MIKSRLPSVTKSCDRQLAKQQALMLDAVGPVAYILEEAAKGQLNQKSVIDAAQIALRPCQCFNACQSGKEEECYPEYEPPHSGHADDDAIFKSAAPFLFGDGFCKKAKERDDELKCLNMTSGKNLLQPCDLQFSEVATHTDNSLM